MDVIRILAVSDGSKAITMIDELLPKDKIKIVQSCKIGNVMQSYDEVKPDVVLLDISWPYDRSKGFDVARLLLIHDGAANLIGITTSYMARVEQKSK